jgi:hypothetical protein
MVYEVPKELGTVPWSSQKFTETNGLWSSQRIQELFFEVPKELGNFVWSSHKM